jgi:hypothetical protein
MVLKKQKSLLLRLIRDYYVRSHKSKETILATDFHSPLGNYFKLDLAMFQVRHCSDQDDTKLTNGLEIAM